MSRRHHLGVVGCEIAHHHFAVAGQSADCLELRLPAFSCGLHDALRSPVVDACCFGGTVDRRPVARCSQYRNHLLDGLCSHSGCNQLRCKFCIALYRLDLRRVLRCGCGPELFRCRPASVIVYSSAQTPLTGPLHSESVSAPTLASGVFLHRPIWPLRGSGAPACPRAQQASRC